MKIELNGQSVFYTMGSTGAAAKIDPAAKNLVFVHGAGMDHSVWVMPSRYFARHGFNVVVPDLPQHGNSDGTLLTSIEAYADWLRDLLAALDIERCALIGHSMGSLITFATAARHPQLIEKIALLGTASPMPVGKGLLDAALDNDEAAYAMANTWSHSPTGKLGRSGQPGLWNLNTGLRLLQRGRDDVYHADLAACNAFNSEAFDAVSHCPALIIAGSKDQMTPPAGSVGLAQRIKETETVLLNGSGHSMLSEQPNAVLDALAGFLMDGSNS